MKNGSKIHATINGVKIKVKISGSIQSPKFLYLTENASEPVPNHRKYGYSIIQKLKKAWKIKIFQKIFNSILFSKKSFKTNNFDYKVAEHHDTQIEHGYY